MKERKTLVFAFTLCFAVFVTGLFFTALFNHWFGSRMENATEFCEAARNSLIKEPANTWSNVAFIISGIYIAWSLSTGMFAGNNNSFTRNQFYATFYPCVVVFLGPGSMAKHATKTSVGGFFDMLSMYLMASFITAYAMQRFFKLKWWGFTLIFISVLSTCVWANFTHCPILFDFFGNTAFAFFLGVGLTFEMLNVYVKKLNHENKWAWFSIASLAISFLVWNLSKTESSLCDPGSLLQGHAVWHIGDAIAAFFLFRYYVSENVLPTE